ncbi:MAG: alpha/beta fold hydrolase [Acidobacteriota bacterium]
MPGLPAPLRAAVTAASTVAPDVAANLAARIFLRPPHFEPPHREWWWITGATSVELEVTLGDGPRKLRGWRWGSAGPAVLLVHGWGGRGMQLGAFAEPLVEAGFRVLALDLPAHGESSGASTSLPEAAEAITAVLDRLGRGPGGVAGLIAHSFGCASTAAAVARGLTPPARTIFLAPPSTLDAVLDRFAELTGFTAEVTGRLRRRLEARFRFDWDRLQPNRVAPSFTSPLLVIHDVDDTETPWTAGRSLADASPAGEFHRTRGLGHFRLLRDAEVVRRAVSFLEGNAQTGVC